MDKFQWFIFSSMQIIKRSIRFFKYFLLIKYFFILTLLILYAAPTSCSEKNNKIKDYWKEIEFAQKELDQVLEIVKRSYIDRNSIKKKLAWVEASRFALLALPAGLQLYPESFFKIRNKYNDEDDIPLPGKELKIKSKDKYVIFIPDYEQYEKLKKEKEKKSDKEGDDKKYFKEKDDLEREKRIKKLVLQERERKQAITRAWKKISFTRKDFEKVISWIKQNQLKYKEYPKIHSDNGDENEKNFQLKYSIKRSYIAAANGFLSSLDPHCGLFSASRWEEQIKETQDSSFEGIGALLRGGGDSPTLVENPLEGRPAVKAGLRAGDIIIKVDNHVIKGWPLSKVVSIIRGEKGTKVTLNIKRKGYKKPIPITIVRQRIDIKNVSSKWVKNRDGIGYIKLTGFVNLSTEEIIDHYEKLLSENRKMKGLILDLRNNPGGLLNEAIRIADLFVDKGVIVTVKNPDSLKNEQVHRANMMDLTQLPLIILINARSASASEIVASAIQDHKRGLVIGDRSFGKASVQQLFPNKRTILGKPDYYIKLTVSRYYAPSRRTIQVIGVRPDVMASNELNGYFPYEFREEDLWNHLDKINFNYISPQKEKVKKLKAWAKKYGKAKSYLKKMKNAAIKPDVQLQRAADYMDAMIALKI
jgi:C-terminal peptidase prc